MKEMLKKEKITLEEILDEQEISQEYKDKKEEVL